MGFKIEDGVLKKYEEENGVTEVVIPDTVTSIGDEAFLWCKNLTNITIPNSVTSIGEKAFWDCSNLASIIIPDSVTSIGYGAFNLCTSLQTITIPDSVTSIGEWAFKGCKSLQTITIPDSVTSIGDRAFYGCTSLQTITIPGSVTSIGDEAFRYCTSLQTITIQGSVTSIGDLAFYGCRCLKTITIPDGLTDIGFGAFNGTLWLDDNYQDDFVVLNGVLIDYKGKYNGKNKNIVIPDNVTRIGNRVFGYCTSLKTITIPDSVTSIGERAFAQCENLTSITIPDSVTSIGYKAFNGCDKLKDFLISTKEKLLTKDIFGDRLPAGLAHMVMELSNAMTDKALKQYILTEKIWKKLSDEERFDLIMTRQSKTLIPSFAEVLTDKLVEYICARIAAIIGSEYNSENNKAILNFILHYNGFIPDNSLRKIYDLLKSTKKWAKAAARIEKDETLMARIADNSAQVSGKNQTVVDLVLAEKISKSELEIQLKNNCGLTLDKLPEIRDKANNPLPPFVFAYILLYYNVSEKTGDNSVVQRIIDGLDKTYFQSALFNLVETNIVKGALKIKLNILKPVCRYIDEEKLESVEDICIGVKGGWYEFYCDVIYSETKWALLWANKHNILDEYAAIRGETADSIRDKYLSDVGLDDNGTKTYDLGNQVIMVKLNPDFKFTITDGNGKVVRSIPKKGADEKLYEAAKSDFAEMKNMVKVISGSRRDVLLEKYLSGEEEPADVWVERYLANPLIRIIAGLVVWQQGENTFTVNGVQTIDSSGNEYTILQNAAIKVAHPMEMNTADIKAWQKYYSNNKLKQSFMQVWEPVVDVNSIKPDRYANALIPYYLFDNSNKHGIHTSYMYGDGKIIEFDDCRAHVVPGDEEPEKYSVNNFSIKKLTRRNNHIIALLDRWTVAQRIAKDDISATAIIGNATLAQLTYYIDIASQNNATNCMAELLELKNKNYPDFDPMDEYSLD